MLTQRSENKVGGGSELYQGREVKPVAQQNGPSYIQVPTYLPRCLTLLSSGPCVLDTALSIIPHGLRCLERQCQNQAEREKKVLASPQSCH